MFQIDENALARLATTVEQARAVELLYVGTPDGKTVESLSIIQAVPSFEHHKYREVVLWSALHLIQPHMPQSGHAAEVLGKRLHLPVVQSLDAERWWDKDTWRDKPTWSMRWSVRRSGQRDVEDIAARNPSQAVEALMAKLAKLVDKGSNVEILVLLGSDAHERCALRAELTLGSDPVPNAVMRLLAALRWAPCVPEAISLLLHECDWITVGDIGVGLYVGFDTSPQVATHVARWYAGWMSDEAFSESVQAAIESRQLVPSPLGRGEIVPWPSSTRG